MLERLQELPRRQLFGLATLVIAAGLCAWAIMARGLFDGVMIFTGMCGVVSLVLILLPARPRLSIEVRDVEDPLSVRLVAEWSTQEFDKEAIVEEQARAALATMPKKPRPVYEEDDEISKIVTVHAAAHLQAVFTGTTDEELERFEGKVETYKRKLWRWLEEVDIAREEHRKVFDCDLRLRELGHAAADHVHLRLRFPGCFQLDRQLPQVDEPPKRPDFAPSGLRAFPGLLARETNRVPIPDIEPIRLPGTDKPDYSMEGDTVVIDYDLGRINQSDHRDVPNFSLRAPGPGEYTVEWEASASGLNKPASGEFTIHFAEPQQGPPIVMLASVEAEREALYG